MNNVSLSNVKSTSVYIQYIHTYYIHTYIYTMSEYKSMSVLYEHFMKIFMQLGVEKFSVT